MQSPGSCEVLGGLGSNQQCDCIIASHRLGLSLPSARQWASRYDLRLLSPLHLRFSGFCTGGCSPSPPPPSPAVRCLSQIQGSANQELVARWPEAPRESLQRVRMMQPACNCHLTPQIWSFRTEKESPTAPPMLPAPARGKRTGAPGPWRTLQSWGD